MVVNDLLNYALRVSGVLGVGQSPLQQDLDDAQRALDMMLKQWQRRRWIVYRLDDLSLPIITYKTSYTIGPGGDFDTSIRPGSIESAFLRQLTGPNNQSFPVDYPLHMMSSRQEWNAISLKRLGSWPASIYYDPTLPLGTIYIWPVPIQTFFELHISPSEDIIDTTLNREMDEFLPFETTEALVYNLAARFRANYGMQPKPDIVALATAALNTLRTNNFAMRPLRMPRELRRDPRMRNPMAGFYPETAAGVPFPVLS